MSLDTIVKVTISLETKAPTRAGFGKPLIYGYVDDAWQAGPVQEYTDLDELTTAGFPATSYVYLAAAKLMGQAQRPEGFLVGKMTPAYKVFRLTPEVESDTDYILYINGDEVKYASDSDATLPEILAGIEAAVNAQGDMSADDSAGTYVEITATDYADANLVQHVFSYQADQGEYVSRQTFVYELADYSEADQIVGDLATIRDVNDDWYCLLLAFTGGPTIEAAAAWTETKRKLFLCSTADSDVADGGSSADICSTLLALSYSRTAIIWHENALEYFPECAWAGVMLPKDPGSASWKFKTLAGVPFSLIPQSVQNIISGTKTTSGKGGNTYVRISGVNITQEGKSVSGEFLDVVRGIDWLTVRMQEAIFGLLSRVDKVPYTDKGIGLVENEMRGVLQLAVSQEVLASYTVTVPKVAEIAFADRANRLLPDMEFSGTLSGAVHWVEVEGTVSV